MTIGKVVECAACTAHRDGADREQQQQHWIGPAFRGERNPPPAWKQQQPCPNRPVEPGEARIGPRPSRQITLDPIGLVYIAGIAGERGCSFALDAVAVIRMSDHVRYAAPSLSSQKRLFEDRVMSERRGPRIYIAAGLAPAAQVELGWRQAH